MQLDLTKLVLMLFRVESLAKRTRVLVKFIINKKQIYTRQIEIIVRFRKINSRLFIKNIIYYLEISIFKNGLDSCHNIEN